MSYKEQAEIDTIKFDSNKLKIFISNIYEKEISNPTDYFKSCSLAWTHTEFNKFFYTFENNISKIIYIIRDPRDVFTSKVNFVFSDYSLKYRQKRKK